MLVSAIAGDLIQVYMYTGSGITDKVFHNNFITDQGPRFFQGGGRIGGEIIEIFGAPKFVGGCSVPLFDIFNAFKKKDPFFKIQ